MDALPVTGLQRWRVVEPVQVFFAELQAEDKPASTIRSYGMDLLRWWRFLWALDIEWNRATRTDARDFTRWMQIANKPQRLHWRHRKAGYTAETAPQTVRKKIAGTPNAITGKPSPGPRYAARTRAHCETDPGPRGPAPSRRSPPTTTTNAYGIRPCRCSSSTIAAARSPP
ncbi:hypothetical protein SVIOM74S_09806 [Streptomyces violarus]